MGALFGGIFWLVQNKSQIGIATQQIKNHNADQASESDFSSWKMYRNENYGFEFRHPDRWSDVKISALYDYGSGIFLHFRYPTTEKNWTNDTMLGYANFLVIGIFSPEQYEQFSYSDGSKGEILGSNNEYIFTRIPTGNDTPVDIAVLSEYNEDIYRTFSTFDVGGMKNDSIDRAKWSAYHSKNYGFEFKYPNSWKSVRIVETAVPDKWYDVLVEIKYPTQENAWSDKEAPGYATLFSVQVFDSRKYQESITSQSVDPVLGRNKSFVFLPNADQEVPIDFVNTGMVSFIKPILGTFKVFDVQK